MTKHTPGPWNVNWVGGWEDAFIDTFGKRIASVHPMNDEGETEANVAIVASAPDLYAALRDLLAATNGTDSFCESCGRHAPKSRGGLVIGPIPHASDCARLAAECAIAKAEGRG